MANSPATDIGNYLQTQGLGTLGVDLFVGMLPTKPDICISVLDAPGRSPDPRYQRDEPSLQILVRGARRDYDVAYGVAKSVKDELNGIDPIVLDSKDYVLFVMIGNIIPVGPDENERPVFSLNFRLTIENTTGGVRIPC